MTELVRAEIDGDGVAVLTLDDAAHRNALSLGLTQSLGRAVDTAVDAGAGAIVLTAVPPVFCAGGSIDELLQPAGPLDAVYEGMLRLAGAPVPTIAAVGGPVIGAGVNLPLFCDIVLASPAARFDPRWLDVNIHPGGGHLWRLERRVGRQGAAALVLCGDVLDGEEAAHAGLAWRCVADDQLLDTARSFARRAATRDRVLVARTKASLDAESGMDTVDDAIAHELDVQAWSMSRPEFHRRVEEIRRTIAAKKQRDS